MDIPSDIFSSRGLLPARVLGDAPERAIEGEVRIDINGDSGLLEIETESGAGSMSLVEPLPGIMISFNDFHMERCVSGFSTSAEVLCVDWCEEGRLEQPMAGGSCAYVAAGDIKVDDRSNHSGEFLLPTGRYRGVTVTYEVERAQRSILRAFEGFPVDLRRLRHRYCLDGTPFLLHRCEGATHIFSELSVTPERIRKSYCQIKALELLLLLHVLDPLPANCMAYFPKSQVARVKQVRDSIARDLSSTVTVEEAASLAHMPLTTFKACFKGVYGSSPAAYFRRLKMDLAAQLLRESEMKVADIGAAVGYDSPSKFSAAFKSAWGVSPAGYRRSLR